MNNKVGLLKSISNDSRETEVGVTYENKFERVSLAPFERKIMKFKMVCYKDRRLFKMV